MKSLTLLLCLGLSAVATQAADSCPMGEWPAAYSVETEVQTGGMTMTSKMFVDGKKLRTESNAGGMESVSIMRPDKKMCYSLMPAQKMVMESALPDETPAPASSGPAPKWEKTGTETVNGQSCTVYKVDSAGSVTTYYLNSDKLPVRMKTDTMTMDYKNFKAGAQDAALFEVPAGYSKPGEAPAASSDNSGNGAAADNPSAGDSAAAPAAEPAKPAKKKKLGGLMGK